MSIKNLFWLMAALPLFAITAHAEIPRLDNGKPDFSGAYNLSMLTPYTRDRKLGERMTFTAAEARLALSLMDGGGLREAASRARMSYATARWYLKILFQKTGSTRQSELTALLVRVTQSARPLQMH